MWPVVQSYIFPTGPVQNSFSCNLDTKFFLHAAGGIYVNDNFVHSGGNLSISGSLADWHGGAVLRSSSGVFGGILRWRSTPGWDKAWLPIGSSLVVCSCFCAYLSREHRGCLSLYLFLSVICWFQISHKIVDSLVMWSFIAKTSTMEMECCICQCNNIWPVPTCSMCNSTFQYCPFRYSCNLDSKFCLHAAGGIYVYRNFTNWGGKIQISGSSAKNHGGALLGRDQL